MARPSRRLRRIGKWIALSVVALFACLHIASIWFLAGLWITPKSAIGIGRGAVWLVFDSSPRRLPDWDLLVGRAAWSEDFCWWFGQSGIYGVGQLTLPLWIPALILAVPTAWLWLQDHQRSRPGRCPTCGYDLRGLSNSAVCPECGTACSGSDLLPTDSATGSGLVHAPSQSPSKLGALPGEPEAGRPNDPAKERARKETRQ